MKKKRVTRDKEFKSKVVIEAIKGEKQIAELTKEFNVDPQQITQWKKELLAKGPEVFSTRAERDIKKIEKERDSLYRTIGHQQVRIDLDNPSRGSRQMRNSFALRDFG